MDSDIIYSSYMNKKHGENVKDSDTLFHLLLWSGKVAGARLDEALQTANVTRAQLAALWALAEYGEPMQLGELAEYLHSVRSNATQMVDRLEAEGLVQRVFDPKDRRVVLVQITEEGRQRYEHGMQARQKLEEELLRQFNQEECEQFASLLRRLLKMWA